MLLSSCDIGNPAYDHSPEAIEVECANCCENLELTPVEFLGFDENIDRCFCSKSCERNFNENN